MSETFAAESCGKPVSWRGNNPLTSDLKWAPFSALPCTTTTGRRNPAVLGSNQWPLPCETGVGCLRINDMRANTRAHSNMNSSILSDKIAYY